MQLSASLNQSKCLFFAVMILCSLVPCDSQMKFNKCCTTVSSHVITTPITSCRIQRKSQHCVPAVVLTSEGKHFCIYRRAPWVTQKIKELHRNGTKCTL